MTQTHVSGESRRSTKDIPPTVPLSGVDAIAAFRGGFTDKEWVDASPLVRGIVKRLAMPKRSKAVDA